MMTEERKLLLETIRLLLDTMRKPISERNHIDKLEAIEAGEAVYANLNGKD
jgi:hypothetical protein